MAVVTLLTDFGTRDGYVGAMKGVILSLAPLATIVDITHDIPPQDIAAAAFVLAQAAPLYPPGTIHVVVVDPGVGGRRRGVIVPSGGQIFVAPDNGVLSLAARTSVGRMYRRPSTGATCSRRRRRVCVPAPSRPTRGRRSCWKDASRPGRCCSPTTAGR